MQLQPRRERGRSDRKAAAHATEIVRLRSEGYTFEAIREALIDIGVELSEATLRREVRRRQPRSVEAPLNATPAPVAPSAVAEQAAASAAPGGTSGRAMAEAFFKAHPSNPLLRPKDKA